MKSRKPFEAFARVFGYPTRTYIAEVTACAQLLRRKYPSASIHFERFADFIALRSSVEAELIYTKTFHIQAICYLDLGYVIFGEDYKRGEFLVHMKEEQDKVGNDCATELPDNLSCVLQLLAMSQEEAFRKELAVRILMPALDRMIAEFDEARQQLKEKVLLKMHRALLQPDLQGGNIYRDALAALRAMLQQEFAGVSYDDHLQQPSVGGQFLKNCGPTGCAPDPLQSTVKQDLSVGMS